MERLTWQFGVFVEIMFPSWELIWYPHPRHVPRWFSFSIYRWDMSYFFLRGGVSLLQQFLAVTVGMLRCTRQWCSSIPFVGHRYCHCEWHAGALELFPRTSARFFWCFRNLFLSVKKGGVGSSGREGRTSSNSVMFFLGGLLKNDHQLSLRLKDFVKS